MPIQHCPIHQEIKVNLEGVDSNAFSILGAVVGAMRRGGVSQADRDAFLEEARSGDYNHLLQTVLRTVNVSMGEDDDYQVRIMQVEEDD